MSGKKSSLLEAGKSIFMLFLISSTLVSDSLTEDLLGVCYGELANELPPLNTTIKLLKELHADAVRLYDADPKVLTALSGTGFGVIVSVLDSELQTIAENPSAADSWVKTHIAPFYPNTRITHIAMGNEVLSKNSIEECGQYLLPAMWNVYFALVDSGLQDDIKVIEPLSGDILDTSWPPSGGGFRHLNYVYPLLQFLRHTRSTFFINVYPYYAHMTNPEGVPLDYAIFTRTVPAFVDPLTGLPYYNLFDAMVDATYSALINIGITGVGVTVGETGWPTAGGTGASPEIAGLYNRNLIQHIRAGGTPNRPDERVPVFLFSLYNEDRKTGPLFEKNWGMFYPNTTKVYKVDFNNSGISEL